MRNFLVILMWILVVQGVVSQTAPTTYFKKPDKLRDGIRTTSLKKVQLDENIIRSMQDSILSGAYKNIHSVLILRHNKLVYEKYFPGDDVIRGRGAVGTVDHHLDSLHDIRSVSKSITGAAVLIAMGQGKIKSPDQRLFDFFPAYTRYDTGTKRGITLSHLMNMSAGIEWDEEISYADTTNSERRMNNSSNTIDFVLSQKMTDIPGKRFNYSGGCSQLLAGIVENSTGMQVDKFTEEYLFKPLGITAYTWVKNRDGKPSAASGLRMRSRDIAKFGLLFLNQGKWKGKQIIPASLVSQTLKSQISTPYFDESYSMGYSNQFWMLTEIIGGKEVSWVQCQGNGGQIILIDYNFDLVFVITAGNYNLGDLKKSSWDFYLDFIYPALSPLN